MRRFRFLSRLAIGIDRRNLLKESRVPETFGNQNIEAFFQFLSAHINILAIRQALLATTPSGFCCAGLTDIPIAGTVRVGINEIPTLPASQEAAIDETPFVVGPSSPVILLFRIQNPLQGSELLFRDYRLQHLHANDVFRCAGNFRTVTLPPILAGADGSGGGVTAFVDRPDAS